MHNRRNFLKAAAAATGYSLFVKAPQSLMADTPDDAVTREAVGSRLSGLAPTGDDIVPSKHEPNMAHVELKCDVFIAGGGLSGVCAAISAARQGARVVLVQDRSRLGGNASSEVRMHPMGSKFGIRETGIIEELALANAWNNEHHSWEMWDLLLYDKCIREPNIKLLLDTTVYRAEMKGNSISRVWARCDRTEVLYSVEAHIYTDCTGDSRLGLECGAEAMWGREAVSVFNEPLADYDKPGTTQGSSILFTSRKHNRAMPYEAPPWARKITKEDLQHRGVSPKNWEYGYWWIELGGVYDTIKDNERLRFELLAIVLGVWDYIKNSGNFPDAENWALETIGMIPGKRESRRLVGDHIMVQQDIEGKWKEYKDSVAFGGWPMDDHPAAGFDAKGIKPYRPAKYAEPYNIPLGSLYSKNISNLMMAGRNISASHVAFSTTRVMKTCAVIGQAVGTAAWMCANGKYLPRDLRSDSSKVNALQQLLLKNDQTILGLKNTDVEDLARAAGVAVTASSSAENSRPENILTGITWEAAGTVSERWAAPISPGPVWLKLEWPKPVTVSHIQLTHDTGLFRTLTITAAFSVQEKMQVGPQGETIADYDLVGILADGSEKVLASVKDNYQRLRRHDFDPVQLKAVRIDVHKSWGEQARLYEVRAYE